MEALRPSLRSLDIITIMDRTPGNSSNLPPRTEVVDAPGSPMKLNSLEHWHSLDQVQEPPKTWIPDVGCRV